MTKEPRFRNRIKKRWPRPIKSAVALAKLDFGYAMAVNLIEFEATGSRSDVDPGIVRVASNAVDVLEKFKVPQSEWEAPRAEN